MLEFPVFEGRMDMNVFFTVSSHDPHFNLVERESVKKYFPEGLVFVSKKTGYIHEMIGSKAVIPSIKDVKARVARRFIRRRVFGFIDSHNLSSQDQMDLVLNFKLSYEKNEHDDLVIWKSSIDQVETSTMVDLSTAIISFISSKPRRYDGGYFIDDILKELNEKRIKRVMNYIGISVQKNYKNLSVISDESLKKFIEKGGERIRQKCIPC